MRVIHEHCREKDFQETLKLRLSPHMVVLLSFVEQSVGMWLLRGRNLCELGSELHITSVRMRSRNEMKPSG